ncbi:type IV toxin-antitoxin system AbiEi family antitoxin domain-containing protein [Antrihabitans sp. YC2-6]|uniref:type IV toxin-antitoxin system AbiEi family antitoxin domain-containing protein n=1 Tax=Antrihabitans sp. YC2-6 TaxID=2799498 RepID=UPI0018F60B64|nr:type IV toxin-antitoxin system AbiEi family antitoxin domain-containing protein [Antrihabitans sp. YC2-6]MBJ8343697.1 DUF559 domain-containing protein [Antrihabitans sp. YC2-6]
MALQDGVVTLAQARDAGMSSTAVNRRVSSGEWARLHSGVFIRADRERTSAVSLRAAVYAAGEGAVAYGPSAAWWQKLIDRPPHKHWITIPTHRRLRRSSNVRLRHRDLHSIDTKTVRSMPVTILPLTVLEAAVELRSGSVMMDRALQKRTSLRMLEVVHERNSTRSGAAKAAALLAAAGEGGASEAERRFQEILRRAGVTGWEAHYKTRGFEIDVAFPEQRLAIEVDGWAWHRDADRFAHDLERQNTLVNAGWRVLRFTWHHVTYEPDVVLAEVMSALVQG